MVSYRIFWSLLKWLFAHLKSPGFYVTTSTDGSAFIIADSSLQIPAFFVFDDPERPFGEPFQRRCEDGKYGWYIRNASNGYTFLMPVVSGDFEYDKSMLAKEFHPVTLPNIYGIIDEREPNAD